MCVLLLPSLGLNIANVKMMTQVNGKKLSEMKTGLSTLCKPAFLTGKETVLPPIKGRYFQINLK
jgi:hypothetical protein